MGFIIMRKEEREQIVTTTYSIFQLSPTFFQICHPLFNSIPLSFEQILISSPLNHHTSFLTGLSISSLFLPLEKFLLYLFFKRCNYINHITFHLPKKQKQTKLLNVVYKSFHDLALVYPYIFISVHFSLYLNLMFKPYINPGFFLNI